MTEGEFFRGLLAALRAAGLEFIDTRRDIHHKRFNAVVEELDRLRATDAQSVASIPDRFVPTPFTERYRELDDALLQLQRGLLGAHNPFYPGVELTMDPETAELILGEFSEGDQRLLRQLANTYLLVPTEATEEVG